ncbi:MAG: MOSC domain-containing protein, partial [Verrucomicrobia bacterium]|nr:MOSC domain-containing protein [Verrucomicrobiota bacterium]
SIEFIERSKSDVSVLDILNLYVMDSQSEDLLRRTTELAALPESWRDYFRKRLWNADA